MTLWGDVTADTPQLPGAVEFSVAGLPVQQGSMRAIVVNGKARLVHDQGKRLTDWRLLVGQAAGAVRPGKFAGPVVVDAVFLMQRPQAHYGARGLLPSAPRHPTTTPDIDKLARALLDALTGVLFADDRQVAQLVVTKAYCQRDTAAGVHVVVAPLGE